MISLEQIFVADVAHEDQIVHILEVNFEGVYPVLSVVEAEKDVACFRRNILTSERRRIIKTEDRT